MAFQYDTTLEELIDHLTFLLSRQFSKEVAQWYYGDIGVYLPSSFGSTRKEDQKAVVALQPVSSRLHNDDRVADREYRDLLIHIIVLVNITPFFEAKPKEAFGERMLTRISTQIAQYLTHEKNITLDGKVQYTEVGDINWNWQQRGRESIRGAAIEYTARVVVPRMTISS